MKSYQKMLNRIMYDTIKFSINDLSNRKHDLIIGSPSNYSKVMGDDIYESSYEIAIDSGLFDNDDYKQFLIDNQIWSRNHESELKQAKEEIDKLKVDLFNFFKRESYTRNIRTLLENAKLRVNDFLFKKHEHDFLSAEGFATAQKNRFLLGMSIKKINNQQLLDESKYWKFPAYVIDAAIRAFRESSVTEKDYRAIARSDIWKIFWGARKENSNIFGKPICEWSDEQRTLVMWSNIYDSINEHPDCPQESIIDDDDILDGWMIVTRRKNKKDNELDGITRNEKIQASSEIFIPVKTKEEFDRVRHMNSSEANMKKSQRLSYIKQKGEVREGLMPDQEQQKRFEANRKFKERMNNVKT